MPETPVTTNATTALLQKHFGFHAFRPMQDEVIEHVLTGHDAIVLMPTGGGKSICYQIPALAMEGLTVVISPLIALMKDQVQALQGYGIPAAYLNSTLSHHEEANVWNEMEAGRLKLVYLSPERLFAPGLFHRMSALNISLFAIDEAHCISNWGHSFRPEYKQLAALKKHFPEVPTIALTATADKAVRSDIGHLLGLRNARMFIASFDRPNLSLAVLPGQKKWPQLKRMLMRHQGACGIIYCSSRNGTEKLADKLRLMDIDAAPYHAGLDAHVRANTQDAFIQGRIKVVCATIAFGMGIDKSDVRFVVHYNMPGNVESYYQEIGRAGRDGAPAETILFYSYRDVQTHLGFLEEIEDETHREVQASKVKRMQGYAEAQQCRRKILLSYFSEEAIDDCGNCDVCKDPPAYFDGTVLAQMTLSAVARCGQKVGLSTLVDVLKGTRTADVSARGLHLVKTFGAGKDTTAFAWQLFIQQFVQQGLLEIDYTDHYHLKLTDLSREVLLRGHRVRLVTPETIKERQEHQQRTRVRDKVMPYTEAGQDLFDRLRELRLSIAQQIGKPAFVVFTDATLRDMAIRRPRSYGEFLEVSGVGQHKADKYSGAFLEAIEAYCATLN